MGRGHRDRPGGLADIGAGSLRGEALAGAVHARDAEQEGPRNYDLLLYKYESYLDLLCDLIVLRAQIEVGLTECTPEMEREFIRTRDGIYQSLETRSKQEKQMGVFQLMDILEGRMVGAKELRKKRIALENRQDEIEEHPLFIRRSLED